MSDFHILAQDIKRKTINCVFHISIPNGGANAAGITWAEAIVKEQGGADAIVSLLPDISSEELLALKAGTLYEKRFTVRFSSTNLTNAQRLNEIKEAFIGESATLIAEKQITLNFMGYEGDV